MKVKVKDVIEYSIGKNTGHGEVFKICKDYVFICVIKSNKKTTIKHLVWNENIKKIIKEEK